MSFWRRDKKPGVTFHNGGMTRRCPVCRKAHRRSEVYQEDTSAMVGTLNKNSTEAFWDGRGDQHIHGGRWATGWCCSRGHRWIEHGNVSCPTCRDPQSPQTLVLHDDEKVRWL